jgi:hypothetical protein
MHRRLQFRKVPRLDCAFPARLTAGEHVLQGRISNLSQGGVFFEGPLLPIGQELQLELQGTGIRGVAQIAHHHASGTGMGLKFVELDTPARHELTTYLDQRLPLEPVDVSANAIHLPG